MPEENSPSQHPEWQDYLETAPSLPFVDTPLTPSHAIPSPHPVSQDTQQPSTRTELQQIAAEHQLGKVQIEYKNEISTTLTAGISFCMLGVLCFLPFILTAVAQMGYFSGLRWTFIIGLGFLGYGINRVTTAINNISTNMLNHNPRCCLCSHGVISIKGKQVQVIRWDQVRSIQKIFLSETSYIPQQYILYPRSDEDPLVIDRVFARFKILGKQIEREVAQHLFPEILAAYRAGQVLNFGPLNVTLQGLKLEETQKSLPWEKLGTIDEYRGYLAIREKGKSSSWENIEVSTMLNLCVLLPLVKKIKYDNLIRGNEQTSLSYQPPPNDPQQRSEWQEYE